MLNMFMYIYLKVRLLNKYVVIVDFIFIEEYFDVG